MSQADSMQADALLSDFSVAGHSAMSDTQRSTFVASNRSSALRDCVKEAMTNYFRNLEDEEASNVYELVMAEVEAPLLEVVMQRSRYNQTKAAETLGLNRGTLRKKLKQYNLL